MLFNDFSVFWNAALAILGGRDPYALPGVYYPLPSFFLFLPLAVLPLPVAQIVWTAIEGIIFVAILRRQALSLVLFMPVVLAFLMGQMVMPMLGIFSLLRSGLFGGLALALLFLKPQIVFFLAPWLLWRWWKQERRQILSFFLTLATMMVASFVVQPDWVTRWLAVSGARLRMPISPSVWGVFSFLPYPLWIATASVITAGVLVWAWRRNDFDIVTAASMLVNPVLISYDFTLLTVMIRDSRFWLVMTAISWVAFAVSALQLNERSFVAITLGVLYVLTRGGLVIGDRIRVGRRKTI